MYIQSFTLYTDCQLIIFLTDNNISKLQKSDFLCTLWNCLFKTVAIQEPFQIQDDMSSLIFKGPQIAKALNLYILMTCSIVYIYIFIFSKSQKLQAFIY